MSVPSRSADRRRAGMARALGVAAVLVVQGGTAVVLAGLLRLERQTSIERPSRAEGRRALERLGPAALQLFPVAGGVIDSFGDDEIVIMVVGGDRVHVRIDPETFVTRPDGPAELSDLYPGVEVVVSGLFQPDGAVLADVVQVGQP